MKVLHILYQSLPQISGSSIRSRDILMSQKDIGLRPMAVTSPFQSASRPEEIIDGIRYLRTAIHQNESISDRPKSLLKRVFRFFAIFGFYKELKQLILKENPQVLHAHAMFFCGLPAIFLGKKFRLPVVYEVRSLWMLKKGVTDSGMIRRFVEQLLLKVELYVMRRATIVVAINDNLKSELVKCGIVSQKIEIVKNAVNTSLINVLKDKVNNDFNIQGRCNFGYIGTLTPHEGIDLLIDAFEEVNMKLPKSKLVIYGSGIEANNIRAKTEKIKNALFMGPITPAEIYKAFGEIDIIVNPRYKNKLTDSVTPLKPLEAMAYEKIVIGSDVGGITELVRNNENGFLFKAGKKQDLINTMLSIYNMPVERKYKIIDSALNYVMEEKSWLANAKKYNQMYISLISSDT
ncbi:glycosyltransferase family 4 protein [Croceivirga sp. JEA036]|uniref:glycosyltransferase family 4 protein n=1 Tax=Croceivirga sp. JEA036 TaxID=2721162 RepID=UPI001438D983|nr:glycosyltransferase family 4 protein [Croceivirga sp. JEA036]NJB37082.1 glycosyltransferase [Croceivirga sp. JEA036]